MKKFIIAALIVVVAVAPQKAEGRRWFPPTPVGQQCWRTLRFPTEAQAGYVGADGEVRSFGYAEEIRVCAYVLRHARAE